MQSKKKKIYFIPILLIALLIAYAFNDVMTSDQAGFREANRSVVYVFLGIIISLSGIYTFLYGDGSIRRSKLTLSLWLIAFWIFYVNVINQADLWISIIHVSLAVWWIVSYHFSYYYLLRNPLSKNFLLSMFLTMFVFYAWANIFIRANMARTLNIEHAVTGFAYLLVLFVPYMSLIRKTWLRVTLWILTVILVFTSFKRGSIIILPLMFITYYSTLANIRGNWVRFFGKAIIIIFLMLTVFHLVDRISDGFLSFRFSEKQLEGGSRRFELLSLAWDNIKSRDALDLFFGTGSGSSIKILGTGVHNEWIEFLFSFGITGMIFYAIMCIILIQKYISMLKIKSQFAPQFGMMTTYVLVVGLFSGMYFLHSTFYIFAFFGLLESLYRSELMDNLEFA